MDSVLEDKLAVEQEAVAAEQAKEEMLAEETTVPSETDSAAPTESTAAAAEPVVEAKLKPAEIAAKVKELRTRLPRADLKACKAAVMASGGDLEAAKPIRLPN